MIVMVIWFLCYSLSLHNGQNWWHFHKARKMIVIEIIEHLVLLFVVTHWFQMLLPIFRTFFYWLATGFRCYRRHFFPILKRLLLVLIFWSLKCGTSFMIGNCF